MSKRALVFPGQASQEVGMGQDIFETYASIRDMYEQARDILGYDIAELTFQGPLEALTETRVTQPALFITSAAFFSLLPETIDFQVVAGHSLGEFSALFAAGVLSFEDTLKIVKVRAEGMQKAGEENPGTMAAILNLSREEVDTICQQASSRGIVQAANYNSPGQIVISGDREAVHHAMDVAKAMGGRRVVELNVSGAFHSPLMASATQALQTAMENASFHEAAVPVYSNCDASPTTEPEQIKANIISQLESPVLWEDSIKHIIADGTRDFLEIGPGRVLQGLIRRIDRDVTMSGVGSLETLEALS